MPGQSTVLKAEGGSVYSWTPLTGLNKTSGTSVVAAPSSTTTYTVVIYNDPCPSDTQKVTVTVHPLPKANFSDTAGCSPLIATLRNASLGAVSYSWTFYDDASTSTQQHPVKTYTNPGTHMAKLVVSSQFGCKDSITKKAALVYPKPVAEFIADPKIASVWDPKIHFTSTSQDAVKWLWTFGDD